MFYGLCPHAKNHQTSLLYLLAFREVKAMQRPLDKFRQGDEFYSVWIQSFRIDSSHRCAFHHNDAYSYRNV